LFVFQRQHPKGPIKFVAIDHTFITSLSVTRTSLSIGIAPITILNSVEGNVNNEYVLIDKNRKHRLYETATALFVNVDYQKIDTRVILRRKDEIAGIITGKSLILAQRFIKTVLRSRDAIIFQLTAQYSR
jgi:hypothetical protein